MKFLFDSDSWQEIYGSIRKNKVRTVITIIGVFWGILLLVGLLGAAKGIDNGFKKMFGSLATNSVFIWTESTDIPFKGFQKGRRFNFNFNDIALLKNAYKDKIKLLAPRIQHGEILFVNDFKSGNFQVSGDYPVLDKIQKKNLIYGRFLNQNDIENHTKVCVIEETIYKQLFEKNEYPIGQYIKIDNVNYKVVGVFKKPSTLNIDGSTAYIPFTTFQKVYNTSNNVGWMVITANDGVDIKQLEIDVLLTLKNLHKIHPEDTRALGSANLGDELSKVTGFLKGMQFLTWFVGIATLIAGVMAIGNILLITVKERTKEIGIRRAIGATPKSIRSQIVLESVFLTLLAGMVGIVLGGGVLMVLDSVWGTGPDSALVNPTVDIPIILIALLILIILGTLIGLIPAFKATVIKPIEALREE